MYRGSQCDVSAVILFGTSKPCTQTKKTVNKYMKTKLKCLEVTEVIYSHYVNVCYEYIRFLIKLIGSIPATCFIYIALFCA